MDKSALTERDICTKFILPAVERAGWDEMVQVREEVYFTKGRIIVRGKLGTASSFAVQPLCSNPFMSLMVVAKASGRTLVASP
jgi:hypothetical protein